MDIGVILASSLALILYLNTLPADFAYDDSRAIQKNPDLLPETPLVNLFYDDFWGTPLTHSGSHKSYRPLCVLTFRINYLLDGFKPAGFHLVNVLLHSLVTGLFTDTCGQLTGQIWTARLAGLLFASHPVHTESVAGVVGRADILACLFFLLAFRCYATYCKFRDKEVLDGQDEVTVRWRHLVGVAVFAACALLSKEQGVTVLAVCVIYDVFIHSKLRPQDLLTLYKREHRGVLEGVISLVGMSITFIFFRLYFMGNKAPEFAPADNPAADSDQLMTRVLTFLHLPFLNLWLLLYPRLLSFDWSMDAVPLLESPSDPRNLCTLVFYVTLGYIMWHVYRDLSGPGDEPCRSRASSGSRDRTPPPRISRTSKVHNGNGYTLTNHSSHNNHHLTSLTHSGSTNGRGPRRRSSRRGSGSSTSSNEDTWSCSQVSVEHRVKRSSLLMLLCLSLLVFPFLPATNLFFYVGFVLAERVLYIPSTGFCLLVAQGATMVHQRHSRHTDDTPSHRLTLLRVAIGGLLLGYSLRTVVRNQDWSSEENLYRAGIGVNPAKAWGNLANILNQQGRAAEAESAYRSALSHRTNMADVHYNLGILLQEQKRYTEAVESYRMAIQCRPRLTMAHLNLAIVYGMIGKKTEAEEIYRHCAEIDITGLKDPRLHEQTKVSALYNLGRLLADQERYQEAVEVYQLAINRRPSHYAPQSLYNMLGEAYMKLKDYHEAEKWYVSALQVKADHIPAHLTMGKLYAKTGRVQSAEDWFLKARSLDPNDATVYQHYGQYLGETGRHIEAADSYLSAARILPHDFELIFNTANALRQCGRNQEAEEYYKKAATLKPHEATAHMNLGAMLHFNGKLAEAEQSYLAALKFKPEDDTTRTNLKRLRNLMDRSSTDQR